MIIERLKDIEQVVNMEVGDVIKMYDNRDIHDDEQLGMLLERADNTMIFLISDFMGGFHKAWFYDITQDGYVNPLNDQFYYDGKVVAFEYVESENPIIQKFDEVLAA